MRGRRVSISTHDDVSLASGWSLVATAPRAFDHPDAVAAAGLDWIPCEIPTTAAAALQRAGRWSLDDTAMRFDAHDWWFQTTLDIEPARPGESLWLCLDGIASVGEVWLDGHVLAQIDGMFTAHECPIPPTAARRRTLVIRCRALDSVLAERRPRPRWRTPMVEHQQLRWLRTTLLGRTPGWSPPAAPVGPWRGVRVERRRGVSVDAIRLRTDGDGTVQCDCQLRTSDFVSIASAVLVLARGEETHRIPLRADASAHYAVATRLSNVTRWWPHTHGEPALYRAHLEVRTGDGTLEPVRVELGRIGFRTVSVDSADGRFGIRVNDVPVFCRGACWTPLDCVGFSENAEALDRAFTQLVDCGMNMVRVGGTMVYESDAFLDRCDAHGILLWQDLMFANMDYPHADEGFRATVERETAGFLARLQGRPSVALICGNSEGEQQAAMWGAARADWRSPLFYEQLPRLCAEWLPGVPYWPSSAHGGAFPHQSDVGTSSYYGVGAYLRPLSDARHAMVRFASECLAFANIPDESSLAAMPGGLGVRVHHASWKTRSPRDLGAGWDFDDVRDHYMELLYGVDARLLRYADHERYLALGRVATGEVMARTFGEWRRAGSVTNGGLIWFLRDLWHGAGWGVVDAAGMPKAAWHHLRRALAPIAVHLSDEGGNGLVAHVVNDRPTAFNGSLQLTLWRDGDVRVGDATLAVEVAAHSAREWNAIGAFEGFRDLTHAYRFGPPTHEIVAATLRDAQGASCGRGFHFVGGPSALTESDVGLSGRISAIDDAAYALEIESRRFAQSVHIEIPGFEASDDYFHVLPNAPHAVVLRRSSGAAGSVPSGRLVALNARATAKVRAP